MKHRRPSEHFRRYRRGSKLINHGIHYHSVIRKNPVIPSKDDLRVIKKHFILSGREHKGYIPFQRYPEEFDYVATTQYMTPDEYMALSAKAHHDFTDIKDYERKGVRLAHIGKIKDIMNKGVIATPYLEIRDGNVVGQEGRHRAIASRELGIKVIPVSILRKKSDIEKYEEGI